MSMVVYQWINFILLVCILFIILKKQLNRHFRHQRKDLEEKIASAKNQYEQLQAEYEEIQKLVRGLDSKVNEMKTSLTRELDHETKKLELETQAFAQKILNEGQSRMKNEVDKAMRELEVDLFLKALAIAREALQKELKTKGADWTAQMIQGDLHERGGKKNYAS